MRRDRGIALLALAGVSLLGMLGSGTKSKGLTVVGIEDAREVAINLDTQVRTERPHDRLTYPSPDGKRVLVHQAVKDHEHDWELFLVECSGQQKSEPVQVTDDKGQIVDVTWLPDSRRAIVQRGWTLALLDVGGSKPVVSRFGERDWSAYEAAASPDGRVAFLRLRERKGKETDEDIVIWDGKNFTTLIENRDFTTLAWSPDGKELAWSTHGELGVTDVATKQGRTLEYLSIDQALYAHHANSLAFSPDGKFIAAVIRFSGGRLVVDPSKPDILRGDRDIFVIPADLKGKTTMFTLEGDTKAVRWERLDDAEPAEQEDP